MVKYIPLHGIIEATLACNFNCIHCGSKAGLKRDDELTLQEINGLLLDLKELGCKFVSYMGGEFFLRKDWIDILKLTKSYNFLISIATNGYLLDDEKFMILKEYVASLCFSLDSNDEKQHDELRGKKGAFKKVIKNIKKSCDNDILTAVYTVINKKNVSQLDAMLDLLLDMNLKLRWKIILASPHSSKFTEDYYVDKDTFIKVASFISKNKIIYNNKSNLYIEESHDLGYCSSIYPNLSEKFSKIGCFAGVNHFGIQSNGNIKGCLSLSDDFIEGNLREKRFKEIWEDVNSFSYSREFNLNMLDGICKNCQKAICGDCHGGCRDFSYSYTGSMFSAPFCLYNIEHCNI